MPRKNKESRKEYRKEYQKSEKGKAIRKEYLQSEKFKTYIKKYHQSEKYKEAVSRFSQKIKITRANRRALYLKDNNIKVLFPHLVKEWHPTKNGDLKPENVVPGSSKNCWWLCNKGHEYQTTCRQRVFVNTKCSKCSNQTSKPEFRIIAELESIFKKVSSRHKFKKTEQRVCNYCNKELSSYKNLHRHLQICKMKDTIIKENEDLIKANEELKKEMEDIKTTFEKFKKQMLDMMNKKCKMHPKTLQKMINSNNTINMTINNNIQYVELGDEELSKVFSKKEKMNILKLGGGALDKIIKHAHLNEDYPQFQTIIITNIKGNQAYIYNKNLKKFIVMDKAEILESLIGYRFDDLQEFYDECKDKMEPEQRENLERLFLLKFDDKYYVKKSKEYNVIIYNECNKDNIKYKSIENGDNDNNELDS
jgi:hypothetical protein